MRLGSVFLITVFMHLTLLSSDLVASLEEVDSLDVLLELELVLVSVEISDSLVLTSIGTLSISS